MKKSNILVLDNYDSFTYNLVHAIEHIVGYSVTVSRNDQIDLSEIENYDKIVLSPGPGIPDEAGILKKLIAAYGPKKCILGVCLGHQAIGEVYGARLINLSRVYHGIASEMNQLIPDPAIFRDIPKTFVAGRYHSWIVDRHNLPDCLEITAEDNDKQIMALKHKEYDVRGVQFHPESVLTPMGLKMIENWLNK